MGSPAEVPAAHPPPAVARHALRPVEDGGRRRGDRGTDRHDQDPPSGRHAAGPGTGRRADPRRDPTAAGRPDRVRAAPGVGPGGRRPGPGLGTRDARASRGVGADGRPGTGGHRRHGCGRRPGRRGRRPAGTRPVGPPHPSCVARRRRRHARTRLGRAPGLLRGALRPGGGAARRGPRGPRRDGDGDRAGPPGHCSGRPPPAGQRVRALGHGDANDPPVRRQGGRSGEIRRRPTLPGDLSPSTIGAGGLNFRVRNGNGCDPSAIATETCCQRRRPQRGRCSSRTPQRARTSFVDPSPRPISTGRLNMLPCVHLRPINVIVYHGPYLVDPVGNLILERASHLDAFSAYPFRRSPTSHALGRTTGTRELRPSRSSRTRDSLPQVSSGCRG